MPFLRLLYRGWLLIGAVLGWINTRILLFFVFFLVMTPLALVRRLRQNPAGRGWQERAMPRSGREMQRRPY